MDAPSPFMVQTLNEALAYWWRELEDPRIEVLEVTGEQASLYTAPTKGMWIHGAWPIRSSIASGDYHAAEANIVLKDVEQNVAGEAIVQLRTDDLEGIIVGVEPHPQGHIYMLGPGDRPRLIIDPSPDTMRRQLRGYTQRLIDEAHAARGTSTGNQPEAPYASGLIEPLHSNV